MLCADIESMEEIGIVARVWNKVLEKGSKIRESQAEGGGDETKRSTRGMERSK